MERKKVVFISGPITGVEKYWEAFEKMEDELIALGFIPISPTRLPAGLTEEQYARVNFATIDIADAVVFLQDWENSIGAQLEMEYCRYISKPIFADPKFMKEVLE